MCERWIAFSVADGQQSNLLLREPQDFGVGGELDAQSVGPVFLTEKSGAIAPGAGRITLRAFSRPNDDPPLLTFRAHLGIRLILQITSLDYGPRRVDLNDCELMPDV